MSTFQQLYLRRARERTYRFATAPERRPTPAGVFWALYAALVGIALYVVLA